MATPLKYLYNDSFFDGFQSALTTVVGDEVSAHFKSKVTSGDWAALELKQRMSRCTEVLATCLSLDFSEAAEQFLDILSFVEDHHPGKELEYLFLTDFIAKYGLHHFEVAMQLIERVTQYTSCEFAIRPYILTDESRTMRQMLLWSKHPNHHVRRLSSEGCRPRLPWAMSLPSFKANPDLIWPILENLKADTSEYVRKSVANNLNDIAKDHPTLVVDRVRLWQGVSEHTDWVVKHGSRTLLKQGNLEVMKLFGFGGVENMQLSDFKIHTPTVIFGENLVFSFGLRNRTSRSQLIRIEYAIHYQKANGTLSPKVYKISEREYEGKMSRIVERKQPFKAISTRKFHAGLHQLAIIVNGVELGRKDFMLVM